jgi:hypothetical protein
VDFVEAFADAVVVAAVVFVVVAHFDFVESFVEDVVEDGFVPVSDVDGLGDEFVAVDEYSHLGVTSFFFFLAKGVVVMTEQSFPLQRMAIYSHTQWVLPLPLVVFPG